MYAGHAALATFAKGKRPRIPFWILVPVAFAPDWLQWLIEGIGHQNREYTHSLVAVGLGATVVALAYWAFTRQAIDSVALFLLYLSHWAADFITGFKPTWPGGPTVGLGIYGHPAWDLLLESALIVVCWLVYRASFSARARRSVLMLLVPIGLIGMQVGFELLQRTDVRAALQSIP